MNQRGKYKLSMSRVIQTSNPLPHFCNLVFMVGGMDGWVNALFSLFGNWGSGQGFGRVVRACFRRAWNIGVFWTRLRELVTIALWEIRTDTKKIQQTRMLWKSVNWSTDWGYETSSRCSRLPKLVQTIASSIPFPGRRFISPVCSCFTMQISKTNEIRWTSRHFCKSGYELF